MAQPAEQLVVSLEARINEFERAFKKASRASNDNWRQIERRGEQGARKLESTFDKATKGISEKFRLMSTTAAGALTAAFSVNQLRQYADSWVQARSKIAAAGEALETVAARQSQLTDLAIRSRADLGATVDLYTSLKRATESLGSSQAQVLSVTETINKAFAVSGASSSTAAGAILQLGQAFASGALRGDELNSVLEGAPPLARLIAKEFGVGVGELKKLGEQGKLTADKVFQALLNGSKAVQEEFAKTTPTVSQAFSILQTSLARYVGELDQATGASATLSGGLVKLAEHANITGPALAAIAAGLAAAFAGGPVVGGITAATVAIAAFGSQIQPIAGELASLGDHAASAWNMIKDGASAVAIDLQGRFIQAAQLISAALGDLDFGSFLAAVKAVGNAAIGAFAASAKAIQTTWRALGAAITGSIVAAMNEVIAAAERAANAVAGVVKAASGGFFAPGAINLGRIRADAAAGKIASEGFGDALAAGSRDYIGDATKPLSDALAKLRADANARAAARADKPVALNDGSLSAPLKRSPATATGAAKSKGSADKPDDFAREVSSLEKQARGYDSEREALGKLAIEQDRAKASLDLLEAAKKAGLTVDDDVRAKIEATADAYATARDALDRAKESQETFKSAIAGFGDDLKQGLADAVIEGRKLDDVLQSLLKRLANKALSSAFDGIFGALTKGVTSGGGSGLLGGLKGILGFADGGYVSGPGTGTSDSIPARLSHGEYVVPAKETAEFLPLLEAIRSGSVPKFADGGMIKAPALASAPQIAAPTFTTPGMGGPVTINSPVTVNTQGGGDPAQNADLARQVAKGVEQQLRGIVADEIFQQSRVGRTLSTRFSR